MEGGISCASLKEIVLSNEQAWVKMQEKRRGMVFGVAFLAGFLLGCASAPEQIVVPTTGAVYAQMEAQQVEMRQKLREDYPALSEEALEAMFSVSRAFFVTQSAWFRAYDDLALPIGSGQMTLRLSDTAFILSEVEFKPRAKILEIGTGTGYFTTVLSRLAWEVYSVEIMEYLSEVARQWVERLSLPNVKLRVGDGSKGWARYAPYDGIVVTAAVKAIPDAYMAQLQEGGFLAIPLTDGISLTEILVYEKKDGVLVEKARRRAPVSEMLIPDEGDSR